ncbi:MAG: hypothetical protein VX152_11520, partial [Pseudomonadota bacterium]|nr:hypothetical protein [Pseudomonadota bacterium]
MEGFFDVVELEGFDDSFDMSFYDEKAKKKKPRVRRPPRRKKSSVEDFMTQMKLDLENRVKDFEELGLTDP